MANLAQWIGFIALVTLGAKLVYNGIALSFLTWIFSSSNSKPSPETLVGLAIAAAGGFVLYIASYAAPFTISVH
jgi:putative Mn2+ efflux pump MntP